MAQFRMALCTLEANCSMQMSLLVYLAVVVGVSSVVLWWNEAKQLVYMALVVRVSSVLLWWKRGGLVYMALVVKFVLVRLCFGRCGTARHLWQYVQVRAPLWVFRGESLALHIVIHSHTDIIP